MSELASGLVPHARFRDVKNSEGTIFLVNGIDAPIAWDGISTTVRNFGIEPPTSAPTLAIGAAGLLDGTYYYYTSFLNSRTGEYSGFSPLSASIAATLDQVTVTRVATTTDTQVDRWVIWRNTDGQTTTFFRVGDQAIGTGTFTDNISDNELSGNEVGEDGIPPDDTMPFIEFFNGRVFQYGSREEDTGTVLFTSGAPGIVGTGTYFRQSHVGQKIKVDGEAVEYTILSVTNTTNATLTTNYSGSTGSKTYKIYPTRRSDITWSSPSSSERFGVIDRVGVYPYDGDLPTGMKVIGTTLALFKRTRSYRFTFDGDPNPLLGNGQISKASSNRGLINNECCVVVGEVAYCFDSLGPYIFDGATNTIEIGQAINRMLNPDELIPSDMTINRSYSRTWHGVFNPRERSVIYFVTTGADTLPKTGLCYDIDRQRWTINRYENAITCSGISVDNTGELVAWVGDENGCLWSLCGERQLEGASTGTLRGTVSSATSSTLTDSTASFLTSGDALKGVTVTIIRGAGSGQTRTISSNTSTVLTLSQNWSINPDATSQYAIGAINSMHRHAWIYFDKANDSHLSKIILYASPASDDRSCRVSIYKDEGTDPITSFQIQSAPADGVSCGVDGDGVITITPMNQGGRVEVVLNEPVETAISVEVSQVDADRPVFFVGMDLVGRSITPLPQQRSG